MHARSLVRLLPVAMTLVLLGSGAALAVTPDGPVYPLPGGPETRPGGSTCFADTESEAAMGKTAASNLTSTDGLTWHYGGGSEPAQEGPGCPFSATPTELPPFDPTRFQRLFWGMSSTPTLALDGVVDSLNGAVETLVFSPTASSLPGGLLVWEGSTQMTWCQPMSCPTFQTTLVDSRFELRATDLGGTPVSLVDPTTVEVTDPVGGLVEVTSALTNFKVNLVMLARHPVSGTFQPAISMYNSLNHPNPAPVEPQTQMGFGGGFRYLSRGPVASLTLTKQRIGAIIKGGIRGALTVDEASTATLKATIAKKLARKLRIKPVVGTARAETPSAGRVPVTVNLTRAAKSKLKTLGKVAIKVIAVVTNTAGDPTTTSASRTYAK